MELTALAQILAKQFATVYLENPTGAIKYAGKVKCNRITGTYFYTKSKQGNHATIMVDTRYKRVELFIGRVWTSHIENEESQYGAWEWRVHGTKYVFTAEPVNDGCSKKSEDYEVKQLVLI